MYGSFSAQAQRKDTCQTQNSRYGAVLAFRALIFMHRRSENELCAQARWFCKTVQNHRACQRKSLVCKIVKNSREHAKSAQEWAHSSRGLAVIFPLCAPPAAEGQKRQLRVGRGAKQRAFLRPRPTQSWTRRQKARVFINLYLCPCVNAHICVYVCTNVMKARISITYTGERSEPEILVYIYIYIDRYTRIYIHIYIYTHLAFVLFASEGKAFVKTRPERLSAVNETTPTGA